jgi:protein-tyrosine phosphatase
MRESTKISVSTLVGWFARGRGPEQIDLRRVSRLVFVCKGNICRSAYAHAIATQRGIAAASYGIDTRTGLLADDVARRIAAGRGISLEEHRTSRWSDADVTRGDLVLGMEAWHAARISDEVLSTGAQIGLLGLWATPMRRTISDPYGLADEKFQACFDVIDIAVDHLARRMPATPEGS